MSNLRSLLPLLMVCGIFLIIKLSSLSIRLSDTNIYFYTAQELLKGNILYKDIFFTNFPLVPYVASFYSFISNGNLSFYYLTASIEVVVTSIVLYLITYKQWQSRLLAFLTGASYLLSFMTLTTSQHQTGVFLAALWTTLSYFFFQRSKLFLTGIFVSLALLTKAYTLPLLLTYLTYLIIKKRSRLIPYMSGSLITAFVILLPSLLLAPNDFFKDVFAYSLTRSQGIDKSGILWFVMQHDLLFLLLLLGNIITIKKNLFFGLFSLFGLLFFILYQDTYYLYLIVLLPLLCLSLPFFIHQLTSTFSINKYMAPTIFVIFVFYNITAFYLGGFHKLQSLPQIDEMTRVIEKEKPFSIYGVNGISQALAYTSNVPLLNNIVDTNDNIFRKGYLHAETLTSDAITKHALVVSIGAYYPDAGVKEDVMTEIIDKKQLQQKCKLIERFFFNSEGIINTVNFFTC